MLFYWEYRISSGSYLSLRAREAETKKPVSARFSFFRFVLAGLSPGPDPVVASAASESVGNGRGGLRHFVVCALGVDARPGV